ncbi:MULTISPECIES: DUF2325 domain-containing protein [unclassified Nitrosomonas]|jgi:hypothetical protein|uniref:DUF2325 domain-containing protein n=1 Tax=unclassified Nitrosomonas TaxID=2609265 RepID=UPI001DE6C0ED|nr:MULTISPECIES: DUF2325 domain-containing protein [unclassified Nitrosomonas]MBX9894998.1 DUF2325 domain-containing protein [Nitrosomonas sp.]WMJ08199.1 DUF2325 domain-containing protein [Nitrosomonas sp. sh817]
MTVLIVGGDYITSFKHLLSTQQDKHIEHWDGRKKGFIKKSFPNETQLVIVICDFVNHSLTHSVKKKASRKGIPLVYCHRSINELKHKLQGSDQADESCCYPNSNSFRRLH